jgi:IS6 family transposase
MSPFKGRHFQRDIILWAVRWYCKYGISYRELQEMLAERGVNVDHTTIYRWVQRYAKVRPNHFILGIPWVRCVW